MEENKERRVLTPKEVEEIAAGAVSRKEDYDHLMDDSATFKCAPRKQKNCERSSPCIWDKGECKHPDHLGGLNRTPDHSSGSPMY